MLRSSIDIHEADEAATHGDGTEDISDTAQHSMPPVPDSTITRSDLIAILPAAYRRPPTWCVVL